jgi:hypothetical protein
MDIARLLNTVTLLLSVTCPAIPALAGPIDDINTAEDKRYAAEMSGNKSEIENILGDSFFYNQPDGTYKDRDQYIKSTLSDKMISAERYQGQVNVYGNTAVSQGYVDVVVDFDGVATPFKLRYLNAWVLQDGVWKLVGRQSSPFIQ